jgi:hypothetical protein
VQATGTQVSARRKPARTGNDNSCISDVFVGQIYLQAEAHFHRLTRHFLHHGLAHILFPGVVHNLDRPWYLGHYLIVRELSCTCPEVRGLVYLKKTLGQKTKAYETKTKF